MFRVKNTLSARANVSKKVYFSKCIFKTCLFFFSALSLFFGKNLCLSSLKSKIISKKRNLFLQPRYRNFYSEMRPLRRISIHGNFGFAALLSHSFGSESLDSRLAGGKTVGRTHKTSTTFILIKNRFVKFLLN